MTPNPKVIEQMQFHITGRQGGKTTAMLRWMMDAPEGEHRVVACHSHQEAMRLLQFARDMDLGLESWQFVGPGPDPRHGVPSSMWAGVLRGRGGEIHVGVENADIFFAALWRPFQVDLVTATGELWTPIDLGNWDVPFAEGGDATSQQ